MAVAARQPEGVGRDVGGGAGTRLRHSRQVRREGGRCGARQARRPATRADACSTSAGSTCACCCCCCASCASLSGFSSSQTADLRRHHFQRPGGPGVQLLSVGFELGLGHPPADDHAHHGDSTEPHHHSEAPRQRGPLRWAHQRRCTVSAVPGPALRLLSGPPAARRAQRTSASRPHRNGAAA